MTTNGQTSNGTYVISYMGLRKAIGVIGMALPLVLALGTVRAPVPGLQTSVSAYYYTNMGDVFVGSLCAIAVFMFSYCGPKGEDRAWGKLAFAFALGVALFPTATDAAHPTPADKVVGELHFTCAACLFLTLSYFSLRLFTKTNPDGQMTPQKRQRNVVYRVCGWTMLASIALIAVVKLALNATPIMHLKPVFWLESVAMFAFGVSWLTKGEGILADEVQLSASSATDVSQAALDVAPR